MGAARLSPSLHDGQLRDLAATVDEPAVMVVDAAGDGADED
jgi:hypothetical protein